MSDLYIFIWGAFATLVAVGPLVFALYLDKRDSKDTVPEKNDSKKRT